MRRLLHRILLSRPNKPRSRLLKAVLSVFGLFFLFGVCVFAIFVGVLMLVASFVLKLIGKKSLRQQTGSTVLDAEYSVVKKSPVVLPR
jgi:hypothetical protein